MKKPEIEHIASGKSDTPGVSILANNRLALTPAEFARLLGRSPMYGYRRVYDGSVKVIKGHGRMMIPVAEVERFLATAVIYNGTKRKSVKREGHPDGK